VETQNTELFRWTSHYRLGNSQLATMEGYRRQCSYCKWTEGPLARCWKPACELHFHKTCGGQLRKINGEEINSCKAHFYEAYLKTPVGGTTPELDAYRPFPRREDSLNDGSDDNRPPTRGRRTSQVSFASPPGTTAQMRERDVQRNLHQGLGAGSTTSGAPKTSTPRTEGDVPPFRCLGCTGPVIDDDYLLCRTCGSPRHRRQRCFIDTEQLTINTANLTYLCFICELRASGDNAPEEVESASEFEDEEYAIDGETFDVSRNPEAHGLTQAEIFQRMQEREPELSSVINALIDNSVTSQMRAALDEIEKRFQKADEMWRARSLDREGNLNPPTPAVRTRTESRSQPPEKRNTYTVREEERERPNLNQPRRLLPEQRPPHWQRDELRKAQRRHAEGGEPPRPPVNRMSRPREIGRRDEYHADNRPRQTRFRQADWPSPRRERNQNFQARQYDYEQPCGRDETFAEMQARSNLLAIERQMRMTLPEVKDTGISWRVFVNAYNESKHFFSDAVNVTRIQTAIKCPEILAIAGENLFEIDEYDDTIEVINKRLSGAEEARALAMLKKLYQQPRIENGNDEGLMNLIDLVMNLHNLLKKCPRIKYYDDPRLVKDIIYRLPTTLKNRFAKLARLREDEGEGMKLVDLIPHLSEAQNDAKFSVILDTVANRHETGASYRASTAANPPRAPIPSERGRKTVYAVQTEPRNTTTSAPGSLLKPAVAPKCWVEGHVGHPVSKCPDLWKLSGKEARELARHKDICYTCCLKHARGACPNEVKLKCNQANCELAHHALFCMKRPRKSAQTASVMHMQQEEPELTSSPSQHEDDDVVEDERLEAELTDVVTHIIKRKNLAKLNIIVSVHREKTEPPTKKSNNRPSQNQRRKKRNSQTLKEPNLNKMENLLQTETVHKVFCSSTKINYRSDDILLPVITSFIDTQEGYVRATFLLDCGSTSSLINKNFAAGLKLKRIKSPLVVSGINSSNVDNNSEIVQLVLCKSPKSPKRENVAFHTYENLTIAPQRFDSNEFKEKYSYLRDLALHDRYHVDGIIGIDNLKIFKWKTTTHHLEDPSLPIGISTEIGDCVISCKEQINDIFTKGEPTSMIAKCKTVSEKNQATIDRDAEECPEKFQWDNYNQEFLDLEELLCFRENLPPEVNDKLNNFATRALDALNRESSIDVDTGHYETPLLWRDREKVNIDTAKSLRNALNRFKTVEHQGYAKGEFSDYAAEVQKLIDKGYAEEIPAAELSQEGGVTHYVPLYFIHPLNKRLRLVYDFHAKTAGIPFNDYLIGNLNLLQRLDKIVAMSRKGRYIIKCDVQEMYLQIQLKTEDRDCARFVFRFNREDDIKHYRMKVLPFGCSSAPAISQYIKNVVAESVHESHPETYKALVEHTYMDDTVHAHDDEEELARIAINVRITMKDKGFNVLKWNANSSQIVQDIETAFQHENQENLVSRKVKERLLGYEYDFKMDTISTAFCFEEIAENLRKPIERPTKRQVLSFLNSLFDPLGLVGYAEVALKILYKRLCDMKLQWDETIPEDLILLWKQGRKQYAQLAEVKIPRNIEWTKDRKYVLVLFCDASKDLICSVGYLKPVQSLEKSASGQLLGSTIRTVNSRREYSIPELEIEAAKLSIELRCRLIELYELDGIDCLHITDSFVGLQLIRNKKEEKHSIFMSNRLQSILEKSRVEEWLWAPTNLQVADLGTKIAASTNKQREWYQPKLFELEVSKWKSLEADRKLTLMVNPGEVEIRREEISLDNFHNYEHLVRVTIAAMKMVYKFKQGWKTLHDRLAELERKRYPDLEELQEVKDKIVDIKDTIADDGRWFKEAQTWWLKECQRKDDEIQQLIHPQQDEIQTPARHRLKHLVLAHDGEGVLRVRSRISEETAEFYKIGHDQAHPIYLPEESNITELIVMGAHEQTGHGQAKACVKKLRERFFILKMEISVQKIITQNCYHCKRRNRTLRQPLMGEIPLEAVGYREPAFTRITADVFGPILAKPSKLSKTTVKRWGLVVMCLGSRGVAIELLFDNTIDSYGKAFERVFALRGSPKTVFTDLHPTFLATDKNFKSIGEYINTQLMDVGALNRPIGWKTKAAYMPWHQGVVERQIAEVKKIFNNIGKVVSDEKHCDTDLIYLFSKVASILNNSPINDYDDEAIVPMLTPNHFLIMRDGSACHPHLNLTTTDLKHDYYELQRVLNVFWKEWISTFFAKYLTRSKWTDEVAPLNVGDIVMTADKVVTGLWRLGRVIEIDMGSCAQTRAVKIRLGKRHVIDKNRLKNRDLIMHSYRTEAAPVISRPTASVVSFKFNERNIDHLLRADDNVRQRGG
jgi:hypothetical protein